MPITADLSSLHLNGAAYVPPSPKRPVVTPVREGEASQQGREQNTGGQSQTSDGRPVFRSLFTEATQADLTAAQGRTPRPLDDAPYTETAVYERPEKRPENGPVSLSAEDVNGLFAYLGSARQAAESQASLAAPPQAYVVAASRYAEQSVVSSGVFAGRGETLELQA